MRNRGALACAVLASASAAVAASQAAAASHHFHATARYYGTAALIGAAPFGADTLLIVHQDSAHQRTLRLYNRRGTVEYRWRYTTSQAQGNQPVNDHGTATPILGSGAFARPRGRLTATGSSFELQNDIALDGQVAFKPRAVVRPRRRAHTYRLRHLSTSLIAERSDGRQLIGSVQGGPFLAGDAIEVLLAASGAADTHGQPVRGTVRVYALRGGILTVRVRGHQQRSRGTGDIPAAAFAGNVVRGTGRFAHAGGHLTFSSGSGNSETQGPVSVTIGGRVRY